MSKFFLKFQTQNLPRYLNKLNKPDLASYKPINLLYISKTFGNDHT